MPELPHEKEEESTTVMTVSDIDQLNLGDWYRLSLYEFLTHYNDKYHFLPSHKAEQYQKKLISKSRTDNFILGSSIILASGVNHLAYNYFKLNNPYKYALGFVGINILAFQSFDFVRLFATRRHYHALLDITREYPYFTHQAYADFVNSNPAMHDEIAYALQESERIKRIWGARLQDK